MFSVHKPKGHLCDRRPSCTRSSRSIPSGRALLSTRSRSDGKRLRVRADASEPSMCRWRPSGAVLDPVRRLHGRRGARGGGLRGPLRIHRHRWSRHHEVRWARVLALPRARCFPPGLLSHSRNKHQQPFRQNQGSVRPSGNARFLAGKRAAKQRMYVL